MRGFKAGSKPKAPRSIKSGTIQGPGTGTSDDVKATVAEGSYVMPADSTAQIGAEQLQGMGAPVDVNLSNGEQLMSPEQVHAVGVQALDALKNATHLPAAQQRGSKGFQPRGHEQGKPELFFADGGVVEEPRKKQTSFDITNTPAAQRAAGIITNAEAAQRAAGVTPSASQPATAPQAAPRADFYTNSSGVAGKGFAPSSSTAVVPAGPKQNSFDITNSPGNPERAARMQAQMNQPVTRGAPAAAPSSSGFLNSAARTGNGIVNTVVGGAESLLATPLDAARNSATSLLGGDPETLPGGSSGFRNAAFGRLNKGMNQLSESGREVGNTVSGIGLNALGASPAAATPAQSAVAQAVPANPNAPAASPTTPQSAPQAAPGEVLPAAGATGNGYTQAGNGIALRMGPDGAPEFSNDPAALDGAGAMPAQGLGFPVPQQRAPGAMRAPEGARVLASGSNYETPAQELARRGSVTNLGNGVGTFSQMQTGDSALALERFERANQEREKMIAASRRGQVGEGGGRVTVVGDSGRSESQQRQAFAAASTPHAGSQNGQLTIGQINAMRGLVADERSDATSRTNAQAGNAAALASEQMRQAGANQRFAQSHALDQQRTAVEVESKGFANRSAQRIEKLYEQYDQAAPEDRAAIAEQLRVLSGKSEGSLKDNFIKVKRPVMDAEGRHMSDQEEIVDLRQQGAGQSAAPQRMPASAAEAVVGAVYQTQKGPARWDGKQFIPVSS